MKQDSAVVVIGAGPYGLSTAAYLNAQHIPVHILGKPMEFWRKMPPRMYLKSSWSGLSISDPVGRYSLSAFARSSGMHKQEPVPLQTFLRYGDWFQKQAVPDVDETYVRHLARDGKEFHLDLEDGRSLKARKVVVAAGISSLAFIPEFARHLPAELASHCQEYTDFSSFKGKSVVVIGSGQSALESAALLHEAEADVELIARGPIQWINRTLYYRTGPAKRIFYPPSDVGPPGVNWLVAFPLLFRYLPDKTRVSLDTRAVRPSGARWLRPRVEGEVQLTPQTRVLSATEQEHRVHLTLSDGTTRDVDHVILGTGYRSNVDAFSFIEPALRKQVQVHDGYPLLNEWFESSIPNLHFVGAVAGFNFGPLCRFVVGAKVPARQIARHAARQAKA